MPPTPARPYSVDFHPRDGYLRAHVSGSQDSIGISLSYWREVTSECRRLGLSRLLVCENLGRTGPSVEYYLVGCELPAIVNGLRVAFVDLIADELASNRLGENVASNRGADIRLFHDEETAIEWLTRPRTEERSEGEE